MTGKKVEDIVTEIALPIIEKNSLELVEVEFIKEGANWYLRIYIDKPGGVSIDDCQAVSEAVSEELDKVDPIEQSYFLEVSSPGLDRPLKKEKDFEKFRGELIEIRLFQPIDGKKVFEGELLGLTENKINIRLNTGEIFSIDKNKAATVRRAIKF
ncbi:MAG: ribosome maturation factor RimP [Clostridiales bacterium]|jgi:ribosome maturation factor RimP|nr:ribosome maturation factor RimP [Eubacteriales bacterium]MDH7564905.1 ribosome maturation factor RimP [Clostridiales bacterium]